MIQFLDKTVTEEEKTAFTENNKARQLLIVTGYSGAGKTSVMRALEDLGFYCIDNLPVPMLSELLRLLFKAQNNMIKVGLGLDVRGKEYFKDLLVEINKLRQLARNNFHFKIIFLESSDRTLVKRYQETRRKHPLVGKGISLITAIQREKELLEPIMGFSDIVLDTDNLNIHELSAWVRDSFSDVIKREILVNVISFGFKYGIPVESNLVFDLRFLPNPYFVPDLKFLSGKDTKVQEFLFGIEEVKSYWERLTEFLWYSIRKSFHEGRFLINVAVGCTGGKHRSVAFAERIGRQHLNNVRFLVHHRDLGKE